MEASNTWPSEEDVEAHWVALIVGTLTREQVHEWTVPWVEGDAAGWHGGLEHVLDGLTTLHGFSMAYDPTTPHRVHHGGSGPFVRSDADIVAELDRWRARRA